MLKALTVLTALGGVAGVALLGACSAGPPAPAPLDTTNEACRQCRMVVSDRRFAAQIVAAGEEPMFFDDLGCLRDHIRGAKSLPAGAVAFVADHRTTEWVEGAAAVFSRQPRLATPMGSGLVAHRDATSRGQDPDTAGAEPVAVEEVLGVLARRRGGR